MASNSKFVFAIIIMLSTLCMMMCSCCNEKDKQILLKFKEGVIDSSGVLSSWSSDEQNQDCCQWKGVTCHNITARVIQLTLWCESKDYEYNLQKCLSGDINLSLLDMEYLQHLDLSFNHFSTISHEMPYQNSSTTLNYIDLSYNENLVIHSLEWLSRIPSLEYIKLSHTNLHMETNWLHWVTLLPSLVELSLSGCQLENISPSLLYANFTSASLQLIDLSNNYFHSELPKWIFNLTSSVLDIYLSSNHFIGQLPNTLPNPSVGKSLSLGDNYLNGSIPHWIGQLQYLINLDISDNYFSGFLPPNLGNLSSLELFLAQGNLFTGVASEANFAKLKNLKYLSLGSPNLTFDFDPHWIPPFQLEILYLGPLQPTLPQWLYTQTSLHSLMIENSTLSFEASDNNFWRFTSTLMVLALYSNSIEGDLSQVLLNSTIIIMSSNNLKGGLPRLSSNVVSFELNNSSLSSGSISDLLCHSKEGNNKLQYLDMSDNNLSGGLSDCWMNWKSLLHVNLGGNDLSGNIPPSMAFLSNLTSLHLHENNLSGDISSSSLQYCRSLSILNVRRNSFSGSIPKWMPLTARILQLRSNKLSSSIPSQICQMPFLTILDIAYNRISGHIPKCLSNITSFVDMHYSTSWIVYSFFDGDAFFEFSDNLMLLVKGQESNYDSNLKLMRIVDLSSNNLTGAMSPQLFSLSQLHFLNLSHNRLTGTMPKEVGNMRQLESLDLSKNELTGEIPESMSNLSFLSNLNLSFNNLRGQIPSGVQLQSFSELSYIGNVDLCGSPLPKNCTNHDDGTKALGDENNGDDDDESEFWNCLYMGLGVGFAAGFGEFVQPSSSVASADMLTLDF